MNLVRGIDLKKISEQLNGASGAETKAVCTEAGMFALRERRVHITQEDFEMSVAKARERGQIAPARPSSRGRPRSVAWVVVREGFLPSLSRRLVPPSCR